jgi:hypothetical protein
LDNLTLYDQLLKSYVDSGDSKAIKTVMLSQDGKSLEFYKETEPISQGAIPAYSVLIPETNLDSCMKKVISALQGNVAIFDNAGQVVDGGVKLSDLITRADVETLIAQAVETSTHLTTVVVEELPNDQDAKDNVIYLIKDDDVTGNDKYQEYVKIQGVLTLIGDTSTNLSDYYTKTQTDDKIAAAKTEAVTEAVTQAGTQADAKDAQVLQDAKAYTDQQVQGLNDAIEAVDTKADKNATDITNLGVKVQSNTDRIALLEASTGISMVAATDAEIRALFSE